MACSSARTSERSSPTGPSPCRTDDGRDRRSKVGGTYRTADVWIEIDDIDLVPFSAVTDDDLARTGEPDREALRRRAAHAGPVDDDTFVYRVEFHVVRRADDEPISFA